MLFVANRVCVVTVNNLVCWLVELLVCSGLYSYDTWRKIKEELVVLCRELLNKVFEGQGHGADDTRWLYGLDLAVDGL